MANFELKFLDVYNCQKAEIFVNPVKQLDKKTIKIEFTDHNGKVFHWIDLDKSTAIKFAKTLRTEINKITESEVDNGRK